MAIQVLMPKIGLTMTEGKILEWKKKEGEWVEKGEIIYVFETEKVTFDVEAPESGFLAQILAQIDETVPVGAVVGLLVKEKGEAVDVTTGKAKPISEDTKKPAPEVRTDRRGKIRATPMAKRLAKERGLDLESLSGSGVGGRIKIKDVDLSVEGKTGSAENVAIGSSERFSPQAGDGKLEKLSGMRRIIAQKMLASKIETAQTYMTVSVDAAKILESREKLAPVAERIAKVRLTITDILMKITASAIALHPIMNTRWTPDGIIWFDTIHMGMAMALEEGLIVPVIWDIGKKSLSDTAKARAKLVENGRTGKLTPDEMKGSTFTLSSLGMFGVEEFTANINQPESAILAVGAILDKPVVVNKEVLIRPIMKLTLSYDHRVIDGAKAAEFMKTLKELMEDPILILA
ncbi:MAG: 2-oxo acid dehydrogenase subunit E2 [Desulfomonile tiedjei]|nr:2-oxo acid dehydrogenase subunit E2 [Desulfomonile tiedjei]